MPAPAPLTLCPAPSLDWSRPAAPAARDFGDIYFSVDGGLAESEAVFLAGCGLPEGWQGRRQFVIGELGFGSGLNFLAAWRLWEQTKPIGGHLHFISFEKFPFSKSDLAAALGAWPELNKYAAPLIAAWPGRVRGFHRLHFGDVSLTLIHDDILAGLDEVCAKVDAWFLDGFSPSKNPQMWSADVMHALAKLSNAGARAATFTVAGAVRSALTEAGFMCEKKPGFGRKRERLEAAMPGTYIEPAQKPAPIIIGAGIGGASLSRNFARYGMTADVVYDPSHIAASGNAAALVKPRLDLQDRPESRFFLASFLYARQTYLAGGFALNEGVTHLPKTEKEAARFAKLAAQNALGAAHLRWADGALELPSSLMIAPTLASQVTARAEKIETLKEDGAPIFLAAGYGIKSLLPETQMRFSRGQISWAARSEGLSRATSYGGYALPLGENMLIGATHDRLCARDPFEINPDDDTKNFAQYEAVLGHVPRRAERPSRASVRVTTADTLPLIGEIAPNRYVLSGLGSRGFVFAPLLAEALVCKYIGAPLPISKKVWARLETRPSLQETQERP